MITVSAGLSTSTSSLVDQVVYGRTAAWKVDRVRGSIFWLPLSPGVTSLGLFFGIL